MSGIVIFTLFVWIVLYSFKCSWVLFWDTIRLLGNSVFLLGLAPKFCWWDYSNTSPEVIFPYHWGTVLLFILLIVPWVLRFFQSDSWEQTIFLPLCECWALFPLILSNMHFPSSGCLLTYMHWGTLCKSVGCSFCARPHFFITLLCGL